MEDLALHKTCRKCGVKKTLGDFYPYVANMCKACCNARDRKYRRENKEKYKQIKERYLEKYGKQVEDLRLQRAYGITLVEYDRMYQIQGGRCAICNKHQTALKQSLNVDHDHKTGKVRSLLCSNCNKILGFAEDSIEMFEKLISYLKIHSEVR